MSIHTQLLRGLVALPVATLLIVAGLLAPVPQSSRDRATAETPLPRTVDFHSTLPGALHIVKPAKREGWRGS